MPFKDKQMNKLMLVSFITISTLGLGSNAFAKDKTEKLFEKTIDSADIAVGQVVKGTGNIIHATMGGKPRKNISILGDSTTDAADAE